jgi:hypothetical protein
MSVNAFVSAIMAKYAEWDRYTGRFGFVSVASATFRSILEAVEEEKLARIANELGSEMPKAVTMFWFKRVNLDTVLRTLHVYGKYSGLQRHDVESNEGNYVITFRHDLGAKWSTFLRHFLSAFVKTALGVTPQTDVSENSVVLTFSMRAR